MTIAPVKGRLENIMNLPESLPNKLVRILAQGVNERSWSDVEKLQKSAWQITDHNTRGIVDGAVSEAYDQRYGNGVAKLDATGRIINREQDWNPQPEKVSAGLAQVGLKIRPLRKSSSTTEIFRGLERGLNTIMGKDSKKLKVCGSFDDNAQTVLTDMLKNKPLPQVIEAIKTGLITDCVLAYENRDVGGDEKKSLVAEILNIFNRKDDQEEKKEDETEDEYEDEGEEPELEQNQEADKISKDDIEGFIWRSQDSCGDCGQYNGKLFAAEDLPVPHPNCRCITEVVINDKRPYMRIYVKDNMVGHVRVEIVDEKGNRAIRGLNSVNPITFGETIYEKDKLDSSGKSVDSKDYLPSQKIFLTKEEYDNAHKRIEEMDKNPPKYNAALYNCDDFVNDIIYHTGLDKKVGDYLTDKQEGRLSSGSDLLKHQIPRFIGYPNDFDDSKPELMDEKEIVSFDKKNKIKQ